MQSIFAGLKSANIVFEPFPHVWTTDALPSDCYAELAAAFPSLERIAGSGSLGSNVAYRLPACEVLRDPEIPAIWREFFAAHCSDSFLQETLGFWRAALEREYPDLESRFGKPIDQLTAQVRHYSRSKPPWRLSENTRSDVVLDCQFVVNSPVSVPSSVRGPHVDKPYKLLTAILYFRHPKDRSTGGDLRIERFRNGARRFDRRQHVPERSVEAVDQVPYLPNAAVGFLNTQRSLHSVTPRSVCPLPRRYVNIHIESYTMRTEGLFELPRTPSARLYMELKRRWRRRVAARSRSVRD